MWTAFKANHTYDATTTSHLPTHFLSHLVLISVKISEGISWTLWLNDCVGCVVSGITKEILVGVEEYVPRNAVPWIKATKKFEGNHFRNHINRWLEMGWLRKTWQIDSITSSLMIGIVYFFINIFLIQWNVSLTQEPAEPKPTGQIS